MRYDQYYDTHSAVELAAYLLPPHGTGLGTDPIPFGTLSLLSISTHRDKFPVSALSRVRPRGFTSGHSTIAGTLAFNTVDRAMFTRITDEANASYFTDHVKADELPLFDISIVLVNEFGRASYSTVIGVTLLDCGVTYSLENILLTENYSYMALDYVPLQPLLGYRGEKTSATRSWIQTVTDDVPLSSSTSSEGTLIVIPPVV
jgi:hypothetical protein